MVLYLVIRSRRLSLLWVFGESWRDPILFSRARYPEPIWPWLDVQWRWMRRF